MQFNPAAKLLAHPDNVKEWLSTGRTSPILVEISPTGFCNASCSWCSFNGKKSGNKIDQGILLNAIGQMHGLGLKAINWTGGGEPSIHPDFNKFVKFASNLGIKQGIFTNGYQELPHQEAFSWIRISITDTGLTKVVKPRVPFGVVLNQTWDMTFTLIEEFCIEAKELGAEYFQVRPALTGNFKTQQNIQSPTPLRIHDRESFRVHVTEYKYNESQKPKEYTECYGYNFVPSIDWNGKVSACLYRTLEKDYILGDLYKQTFFSIWEKLAASVPAVDSCWNCCKNHEINKLLYSAKNARDKDFL